MKVLVKKMEKLGLLRLVLIFYAIIMIALGFAIPITMIAIDITLMVNPTILALSIIDVLFFGSLGYFTFIRPYVIYRKLPKVLVETDDEFLYIHSIKEAKIPLTELKDAEVYVHVPYLFQPGFLREFIIFIFSYNYGDVFLEVPNYGKFKMPFIANAEDAAHELGRFISTNKINLIKNNH